MKSFTEQECALLRTTFAATLVALQRGRVPLGPEHQLLLKETWDLVREAADAPLAFEFRKPGVIQLPFGPGLQ
jgi:hypothetical protein